MDTATTSARSVWRRPTAAAARPWQASNSSRPGARCAGGIGQTTRNYTGQRLDGSGLLYYHARYYDPALGRFLSPDTVVPGAGALTAAPHDATAQAAWGQGGGGPANPQALNRYSYVLNNPVNATDPTGHHSKAEPGGGGKGTGGGGRGGGTGGGGVASPPLRGGPKPGTYYDGGRYVPLARAAGDAATVVVGAALIADGVQQTIDSDEVPSRPVGTLTNHDRRYWKKQGVNPENIKEPFVGRAGAEYDVYTDGDKNVWIKRKGAKDSTATFAGKLKEVLQDPDYADDKVKQQERRKDNRRRGGGRSQP